MSALAIASFFLQESKENKLYKELFVFMMFILTIYMIVIVQMAILERSTKLIIILYIVVTGGYFLYRKCEELNNGKDN